MPSEGVRETLAVKGTDGRGREGGGERSRRVDGLENDDDMTYLTELSGSSSWLKQGG